MRGTTLVLNGLLLLGAMPAAFAAAGACDKACMEGIADRYRAAYVKHDAKGLPLARNLRYTENGVVLKFPDGTWDTVTKEVGPALTLSDTKSGNVGIYTAFVQSHDTEGYLAVRLKIVKSEIAEIEHIVSTRRNLSSPPTPIGPHAEYKPDFNFMKTVDPAKRLTRAQLIPFADGYFSTLQQNDGSIRGTAFSPEASRIENGKNFPEIEKGFKSGYYRFNEAEVRVPRAAQLGLPRDVQGRGQAHHGRAGRVPGRAVLHAAAVAGRRPALTGPRKRACRRVRPRRAGCRSSS